MHGGRSTGPTTAEGLARSRRARWKHGLYSEEMQQEMRRRRAEARALREAQRAFHEDVFAHIRALIRQKRILGGR
jgi:hypothetical protein